MGKIAIVGVEGSGKTVLMAALSECYQHTSDSEPYLMAENQSAFVFMEQVPHKLRVAREWPAATGMSGLKTLKWTLRCGKEVLNEIEMLDYPGELYRLAFGDHSKTEIAAHRAEIDEFLGHLTDAEMLVVLFNLADLQHIKTDARSAEAAWITRSIFDFAKKLPNLKRRLLVFTQADRFAADLASAGGPQGLLAKSLSMLHTLHPDLPVIAIAAVDGTDADGRPREGYSSAACHELMRAVLYEADATSQTALNKCKQEWANLRSFVSGGIDAYSGLLSKYESSIANLTLVSRPLAHFYQGDCATHNAQLTAVRTFVSAAKIFVANKDTATLAQESTWESLLRSAAEIRVARLLEVDSWSPVCASPTFAPLPAVKAFIVHYAALMEKQTREQKEMQELELEEAKQRKSDMWTRRVVVSIVVLLFLSTIAGSVYLVHQEQSARDYRSAQATYESEVAKHQDLLDAYGGEKWRAVADDARLAASMDKRPARATRLFEAACVALPQAVSAAQQRWQATRAAILAVAHQAKNDKQWQVCFDKASEVLALEATHVEALSLAAESARKLSEQKAIAAALNIAHQAKTDKQWQVCFDKASEVLALEATHAEALVLATESKKKLNEQQAIAVALNAASQAKAVKQWQVCLDKAAEVLGLDVANAEALALKTEAQANLVPTLTIIAEAGGKEVAAEISDGRRTYTAQHIFVLKPGANYRFVLTYPSSAPAVSPRGNSYVRYLPTTLAVTVDWRGPQTRRVALEEQKDPTAGNVVNMAFVEVAPGSFEMGSNTGESDERPVHTVRIMRTYWVGKYEVTQAQWRSLMGDSPSRFKGDDLPVESVSSERCVEFCTKLTDRERAAGRLPAGYAYHLPTEAEWEYAARGGSKSRGYTYSGGNDIDNVAWYTSNSGYETHAVGTKGANELGLHDMSGNVWELCWDDRHASYVGAPSNGLQWWGYGSGSIRVVRGGGWFEAASACRSVNRCWDGLSPSFYLGFRAVLAPAP